MRSKADMQRKFKHYMEKSRKILHKARDLYVKSMEDCASKVSYNGSVGACPAPQMSRLPRSFSVNYTKRRNNDEKLRELLEAISKKLGRDVDLKEQQEKEQFMDQYGTMKRSFTSIGLGMIGRIDEDKPCNFEDDLSYPRSRSYAARRNFEFLLT